MAYRQAATIRVALTAAAAALAMNSLAQSDDALDERLDAFEAQVVAAEDVAAIKRLQRQYGYYVDKGMWEDVADLYTKTPSRIIRPAPTSATTASASICT